MSVDEILEEALTLSAEDRDRLLVAFARSLEPRANEAWRRMWSAEIERRIRNVDKEYISKISRESSCARGEPRSHSRESHPQVPPAGM